MNCPTCGPTVAYLATEIKVCWCGAERCGAHMVEHVAGCGAYKNPATAPKPETVAKVARLAFKTPGFESIGGLIQQRFKRRR